MESGEDRTLKRTDASRKKSGILTYFLLGHFMQMAAIKMNENFGVLFSNGSACFKNEYGPFEMPKARLLPYAKLKVRTSCTLSLF